MASSLSATLCSRSSSSSLPAILPSTRINTYYRLANIRMMLVMGNGVEMESLLDGFLSALKGMGQEERQQALGRKAGLGSARYFSGRNNR